PTPTPCPRPGPPHLTLAWKPPVLAEASCPSGRRGLCLLQSASGPHCPLTARPDLSFSWTKVLQELLFTHQALGRSWKSSAHSAPLLLSPPGCTVTCLQTEAPKHVSGSRSQMRRPRWDWNQVFWLGRERHVASSELHIRDKRKSPPGGPAPPQRVTCSQVPTEAQVRPARAPPEGAVVALRVSP
ncbi:hypothetical protein H1C71_015008, partial [Ictidomys tridecemlineatus]